MDSAYARPSTGPTRVYAVVDTGTDWRISLFGYLAGHYPDRQAALDAANRLARESAALGVPALVQDTAPLN